MGSILKFFILNGRINDLDGSLLKLANDIQLGFDIVTWFVAGLGVLMFIYSFLEHLLVYPHTPEDKKPAKRQQLKTVFKYSLLCMIAGTLVGVIGIILVQFVQ